MPDFRLVDSTLPGCGSLSLIWQFSVPFPGNIFIASRRRLQLRTNDFSHWLESRLDLGALAKRVNRIDIYTNTLESALQRIISLVEREMDS